MSSYPKHDAAIAYARAMIGVHEVKLRENGYRSNRGPIQKENPRGGVDFFQEWDFLAGVGYPWCASFGHACWGYGAKHPLPYKSAGAYDMLNWANRNGWQRASALCLPGDFAVWNVGEGHLSVIESQTQDDITTIDGNHMNHVMRVTRSKRLLRGAIHIPEDTVKPRYVSEPFWVVTTSVNGKKVMVFTKFATKAFFLKHVLPAIVEKYGRAGLTIKRGGSRKRRVS